MLMSSLRRTLQKAPVGSRASTLLGVEQEFDLFSGESTVDFRELFPRVIARTRSVPFRNCDTAAILDAGYMLACDGREAEFATAPISYAGAGPLSLAREVSRCRTHMLRLLARTGVRKVRGYSTHLSVSVPAGREREIAEAMATAIAPALILLMEAPQSPGLLIRPRRARLEIGSEYIDDEQQLAAAIVLLAGAVHAYLRDEAAWARFPHLELIHREEANIRPGIYLPHDAFGESIYALGHTARLQLQGGGSITAGDVLQRCAALAADELRGSVSRHALEPLLRAARRRGSLPIERTIDPGHISWQLPRPSAPEARTLKLLTRIPGTELAARFVDWEGAAFAWRHAGDELIVGMPWDHLPALFSAAGDNDLTRVIPRAQPPQPLLNSLDQLHSPQTFHHIDAAALGDQALTDKGRSKSKAKPGPVEPTVEVQSVTMGQTLIAHRPPSTSLAQTLMAHKPVVTAQVSTARPTTSIVGWVIAVLAVAAGALGIVFLSKQQPPAASTVGSSQGIVVFAQLTATPAETPVTSAAIAGAQCSPSPVDLDPPSGSLEYPDIYVLRWQSAPLGPGQQFVVVASTKAGDLQGPNARSFRVGTSTSDHLSVNLQTWKYAGQLGTFYWAVRIEDARGNVVDCGGLTPFSLVVVAQPAGTQGPLPAPKPKGTATLLP